MATAVIEVFQAALGRDAKRARTSAGGTVLNAAGGAGSFAVSDMTRARRFLILGAEGGTYYASEPKLAIENAGAMARLIAAGRGVELVELTENISVGGRAAKQGPTLFALAMCARLGDVECRRAAYAALGKVCRIPTHLFTFIGFAEVLGVGSGWGRMQRRAISEWYGRDPKALAYAVTKYRNREGWTHRDVLRLAHVKPATPGQAAVFNYAVSRQASAAPANR
jgi:60 kDa SS-A/Ro ribonucleoprotein